MDVPNSEVNLPAAAAQHEWRLALKFCGSLVAALLFLPPGGLLWQPGAVKAVGGWCLKTLLALVC